MVSDWGCVVYLVRIRVRVRVRVRVRGGECPLDNGSMNG